MSVDVVLVRLNVILMSVDVILVRLNVINILISVDVILVPLECHYNLSRCYTSEIGM